MTDKNIADIATRIVTTDIGGRGTVDIIMDATRDKQGPNPAMQAARTLRKSVDSGETVLVLTGFLIPPMIIQETDGPVGAVSIARAIREGLDANPVIACEPAAVEICRATANAGGLSVIDRSKNYNSTSSVTVEPFPIDRDEAVRYSEEVIEEIQPSAVVSVEKVGPNQVGKYHNMAGYDITSETSKLEELYDRLDEHIPTIAVGDAGNEIGMGTVETAIRDRIPYGELCQCSCGEGIAGVIEADVLVPAAVSNWGAHAIVTNLSELTGDRLLHSPAGERRMLEAACRAGGIDGIVGGTDGWCDGLPPEVHQSIVRLLRELLKPTVHSRGGGELGG